MDLDQFRRKSTTGSELNEHGSIKKARPNIIIVKALLIFWTQTDKHHHQKIVLVSLLAHVELRQNFTDRPRKI